MSDLNDALKDSYIGKVADALQPYTAELTTAGFDLQPHPATRRSRPAHRERGQVEQQVQDAVAAVQHTQDVRTQFYTLATTTISSVEGALGKSHELSAKLFARLGTLSRLTRGVAGYFFTRRTRFALGHGGNRSSHGVIFIPALGRFISTIFV
jgi:hypothetical protein